ncbi:MAG: hypothetical protein PHH04_03635 [Thomasclavelia sp.]|nr:hypothetical protein [Thomasclavelia sp.]
MGKIKKVLLALIMTFILTGCVQYNVDVKIEDENTGSMQMSLIVKKDALESSGYTMKELKNILNGTDTSNYKTTEISKTIDGEKYVGYKSVAKKSAVKEMLKKVTKEEKNDTSIYTLKLDTKSLTKTDPSSYTQTIDLKKVGVTMTATIEMPGNISSSTVGKVDGNKVTIDIVDLITDNNVSTIKIVSKATPDNNVPLIIAISVGVLIVLVFITMLVLKLKKKKNKK